MMTIQWNTLRVGDGVLVHVGDEAELMGGVVAIVTPGTAEHDVNEVAVRVEDGDESWYVWPPQDEVHTDPLDVSDTCAHCVAARTQPA